MHLLCSSTLQLVLGAVLATQGSATFCLASLALQHLFKDSKSILKLFYLALSEVLHFFLALSLHSLIYTAISQFLTTLLGMGSSLEIVQIVNH